MNSLIVAVPARAADACAALRGEADEVVCLHEPAAFFAVGAHYDRFEPTEDDEVRRLIAAAQAVSAER